MMPRVYVLINPHDRQQRDFDIDPDVIVGVRRADGSGWVDTSDPFVYEVGESFSADVKISPYSTLSLHGTVARIARVDVRDLQFEDIAGVGFDNLARFFEAWAEQHDADVARAVAVVLSHSDYLHTPEQVAEMYRRLMQGRPSERYQAWRLELKESVR